MQRKVKSINRMVVAFEGHESVLVELRTDDGNRGFGEAVVMDNGSALLGALHDLEPLLIGHDAYAVERFRRDAMQAHTAGSSFLAAIGAVEVALWDIKGKALNVPAYQCFGGRVRDRIRVCLVLEEAGPTDVVKTAGEVAAQGITAVKFCPLPDRSALSQRGYLEALVSRVQAVREAVGSNVDLVLDLQQCPSPSLALQIGRALEGLRPCLLAEPCQPGGFEALVRLTASARLPICIRADMDSSRGYLRVLERRAAGVLAVDVGKCGGLSTARHIASAAENGYTSVIASHSGTWTGVAAAAQLAAMTPNLLFQELQSHQWLQEAHWPVAVEGGYIAVPEQVGASGEPDMDAIRQLGGSIVTC